MSLFNRVENASVVLRKRGVYREAPVYTYSGYLFSEERGGFLKLLRDGQTSSPDVAWFDIHGVDHVNFYNGLGLSEAVA